MIKSECTKVSNEDDLQRKTTTNGRRPQNMKSGISQQPLVGSYSNLKLKLWDQIRVYKGIKSRRPPAEDDLKIWKVEYFSFHWSDLTQIWNWSKYDQIRAYKDIKWRRPPKEDDHQPLVRSYSNLKLKLWVQIRVYKGIKWRRLPVEDDLKIWKVEYLSNHWSDLTQIWNLS